MTPAEASAPDRAGDEERAARLRRALALAALAVVAAIVAAILLLADDGGSVYKLRFQTAGQLVTGDEVQIGGRGIGTIDEIELTDDNQAEITVTIEEEFAPLREGTTAVVRATSLSGIANRYIALTPGPNNAPAIPERGTITGDDTTSIVDLDQLFDALDAPTRSGLRQLIRGFAAWYAGRGRAANRSARYFAPALSQTNLLIEEALLDERAFERFVINTSALVSTIAQRRDDLAALVGNADVTTGAIAAENDSLSRALAILPATLRRANTAFVNLRVTLDDLDVLVAASKPATRELAPFLRELRPLVAAARPTLADLRAAIISPGANNDLIDVLVDAPRLARVAVPAFDRSIEALQRSQPVLEFIRPYTPELVGWIRDFGQGAANYDANGHFARIAPAFNAFALNSGVLVPIPTDERLAGLETGVIRRCPGAASQFPPDGSAPFTEGGTLDCDPSLVLPGP